MFNKETEYAIRALVYIKLQNIKKRRPGTTEIAKEIDAPPFFVAKILQRLVRSGFLESMKGKGGGFFFDENKPEVPLSKLVTAIEGGRSLNGCVFGLKQCDENNPCPLHYKYAGIRNSLNNLLSEETIGILALKIYEKETNNIKTTK
ncbi:MAG TPA: Rrf2 family transcriptional regulator [Bacteroidales bacterium]|nr:Rrf2 family transcriptional regulator [Bacteroidales bacterium]